MKMCNRLATAHPTQTVDHARSKTNPSGNDKRTQYERGASLVEFAVVLPLLLALLFGVIESSFAFAQLNDVRFGAREGARAAAVDVGDVSTVGQLVCDRMDLILPSQSVTVILEALDSSPTNPGEGSVGASARLTVTADLRTLTGFFNAIFGGVQLSSVIEFRVEQPAGGAGDATWWAGASSGFPGDRFVCP